MKKTSLLSGLSSLVILLSLVSPSTTSAEPGDLPLNGLIPETADETAFIELAEGKTSPVYSTSDAIVENLLVETTIDSDNTGERDLVSIKVMRPNTEPGVKVPVIYEMSPYRAGLRPLHFFDVDVDLQPVPHPGNGYGRGNAGGKPFTSGQVTGQLANYYVPRGYAVILGEGIGSGRSTGCATSGDKYETLGTVAVIEWLNGNARAFNTDGKEVFADWTTGNVGMTGASYNGTLATAAATTGVEGLKTIVPVVAISNWYDYFRANGAVVAPGGYQGEDASVLADAVTTRANGEICDPVLEKMVEDEDRITGDYNEFWDERNYLNDIENIEASVFLVHGLNDRNVRTKQFSQLWEAIGKYDIPRKMWLHQGGHRGAGSANNWQETQHKWYDYWLYGLENGITEEPKVDVEREDQSWHKQDHWPHADVKSTNLYFQPEGEGTGSLEVSPVRDLPKVKQTFTDAPRTNPTSLISEPDDVQENRVEYTTDQLAEPVHMSGTPEIKVRASLNSQVSNLSAFLVDYKKDGTQTVVTRGWMDAQNIHGEERSISLVPGRDYTFEWDMQPHDYVFNEGSRIGVVVMASDRDHTLRPFSETEVSLLPTKSYLTLPIINGKDAIK
ncbi:Xaa-Pro dipeptidyl-peptidase [Salipaludibacillus aurantiacus]|uniref:Xaa-Pro dipeptidyl-peptidase n=1 Tax=Salipaludibacillus aurantiacus TaxID=1601833 RepID=A0A1H9WC66_9BACI|nr:Xaa-Pro dipeptidyl-peptidase [Salipaludibacillus aurantiacus]SES31500.1 X-Pro dipeptidyl-peptidase [Salipaludibacillus aurantiacus]